MYNNIRLFSPYGKALSCFARKNPFGEQVMNISVRQLCGHGGILTFNEII